MGWLHEVTQLELTRRLKPREQSGRCVTQAQVHIPGGACALDAEFQHEAALQRRGISEDTDDTREESLEDEPLAAARELPPVP